MKKALILIDYQNDFCHPKGTMYIKNSEKLIDKINAKILKHKKEGDLIIATKDWHPKNHSSFKIWPPHSIINTWGAQIPIPESQFDKIINKGYQQEEDSYSGFLTNEKFISNGLHEYLQEHKVIDLIIIGIATDYCVSTTIQHAIEFGYNVEIDLDCCLGVEQKLIINKITKRF